MKNIQKEIQPKSLTFLKKNNKPDLRHTAVALAIKDNKHPFEISKMLGHTSIKTTFDVYGHLLQNLLYETLPQENILQF